MTVDFLTRATHHQLHNNPLIRLRQVEEYNLWEDLLKKSTPRCSIEERLCNWYVLGHDIETRFELPEVNASGLLLSAFCNENDHVLVIDNTTVSNSEVFTQEILSRCLFVSHNADFEARWGVATGFLPMRYACTMVNSKRLLSGQKGFKFDLISEINRRLGYDQIPEWMEKDIRKDFKDIQFFEDKHILYNAADTIRLKAILVEQLRQAELLSQYFLHNTINSRIIIPIAKAEITGIRHDTEKWLKITAERRIKSKDLCESLDQIIVNEHGLNPGTINPVLIKALESKRKREAKTEERKIKLTAQLQSLEAKQKTHLKSYQKQKEQLEKLSIITPELEPTVTGVNWGSQKQVIETFKQMGVPLPEAKDKKTHQMKPGVGKDARANWFVTHPNSAFVAFMKTFDKFKKTEHNIKSFGEKWVEQYVRNGRAYTSLDQAGADTGRFSSGSKGKKIKTYYNGQQIPGKGDDVIYRSCFIADEGRKMIIADYSNCEGVVMISLSGDLDMKKITEIKDQHSYLGTLCWRAVYNYRYQQTNDPKWKELADTYVMDQSTEAKKEERSKFKNSGGLFPVVYGVSANKVAATSQITEKEGQVMIDTIKAQVPKVVQTLDAKSKEASTFGFVVHNKRTGSRRWFTPILDHIHYKAPITKGQIIEAEMAARNSPIQGTNSDLMKEAIAMLELWVKLYKQDVRFLLTVHDELLCDCPADKAEFYAGKIKEIMKRAAKAYLIKEIDMDVSCHTSTYWEK